MSTDTMVDFYPDSLARVELEPRIRHIGVTEVARRVGISQASISQWLRGRNGLDLDNRLRVAMACGCSVKVEVGPLPPLSIEQQQVA